MTWSKKTYQEVARILSHIPEGPETPCLIHGIECMAIKPQLIEMFCKLFERDHPRFSSRKFRIACSAFTRRAHEGSK